jgi:hypothetical protein
LHKTQLTTTQEVEVLIEHSEKGTRENKGHRKGAGRSFNLGGGRFE